MDNSTKSSKFRLLLLLVGGVILLLVVGGLVAYPKAKQRWTAPLGPGLELPTYTPTDPYLSASRLTNSPTIHTMVLGRDQVFLLALLKKISTCGLITTAL